MKEFILFTMVSLSFMQLQSPPVRVFCDSNLYLPNAARVVFGCLTYDKTSISHSVSSFKKNFLALFVSLSLLFQFLLAWLVLFWLVLTASLIFNFIPPTSTSSLINCLAVSSSSKVISLTFWLIDSCYLSKLLQSFLHSQLDPWRHAQK